MTPNTKAPAVKSQALAVNNRIDDVKRGAFERGASVILAAIRERIEVVDFYGEKKA